MSESDSHQDESAADSRTTFRMKCPDCGAENDATTVNCWICQHRLEEQIELPTTPPIEPPAFFEKLSRPESKPIWILAAVGIIVVGGGIAITDLSKLPQFVVVVLSPCLYWWRRERTPVQERKNLAPQKSLLSALGMILVCGLVMISIGIAFLAMCMVAMGRTTWH
ncbi:hypothetical protein [Blastopirellula marina]|uniref:Uncharacterized protein n=1 Tax=Blastopirellula marina DSM 3645 TaxID=314230 RepID=A3ZQF4_9BACT|nr:hypothetical protein [Blastopirellula marina]EAQ81430.1 hypothetical protein DSM3645_23601 [Blastopirellula marina DSM 3645]